MWLDQLAKVTGICSALAIVIGAIYASIELRNNTRAVRAAAFQQVINSFAQISFEIANNRDLVELFLRGAKDFKSLNEVDRAQFSFMLLSFLRRAENVLFQSSSHVLSNEHWPGIRSSVAAILTPHGSRDCWVAIKDRFNPEFQGFVDSLLSART